jgi:archaellum biogenesis ATPase FlaH
VTSEKIKIIYWAKGIPTTDIIFSAISFNKTTRPVILQMEPLDKLYSGFTLNQNVSIQSKDVNKIEDISRQSSRLLQELSLL